MEPECKREDGVKGRGGDGRGIHGPGSGEAGARVRQAPTLGLEVRKEQELGGPVCAPQGRTTCAGSLAVAGTRSLTTS